MSEECATNTDKELWREVEGDFYSASLFVTKNGGIGIEVGGTVFVRPIRYWHSLAFDAAKEAGRTANEQSSD